MQVILIQNVPGTGKIDDIKEVSEGYARNFLFAQNLALPVTKQILADLKIRQNKKAKDGEMELRAHQSLADKLDGLELEIKERVSAGDALYAAVGPQKVSDSLAKRGFKISKDQIMMKPIKQTGEYSAKIKFPHGLEAQISVIISKL